MQKKYILIVALVVLLLTAGLVLWCSRANPAPPQISVVTSAKGEQFPDIDESDLSPVQKKIIDTAKTEFKNQPDYKKYTEGNSEAWCADFVSWVYESAGGAFTNPNSGSWRIPGTYTLREYLSSEDRLRTGGSGYTPKPGDLMLYDNPNSFGQHVNIVLKTNSDGSITTVGGNEPGGIRVKTHNANKEDGFVGYGILR